jgi:hypothetical protein
MVPFMSNVFGTTGVQEDGELRVGRLPHILQIPKTASIIIAVYSMKGFSNSFSSLHYSLKNYLVYGMDTGTAEW